MKPEYTNLFDRVKAAVVDGIVLIAMMFAASEILALFDNVPNFVRVVIFIFVFVLYEPLLVSIYGGTIGHSKLGITVRKDSDPSKKVSFFMALIRFVAKAILGTFSLFSVTSNDKRKAIHDYIANSVVIKET